jgi:hypothetical protein
MLRGQGLGRSVSSVERGGCRARTRKARGARVHIELSRSMRHRRDGLVEPDHFFYGRVTVADIPEIVDGLVKGQPVKRLVITADQHEA